MCNDDQSSGNIPRQWRDPVTISISIAVVTNDGNSPNKYGVHDCIKD